jgi:hypothetical protein
VFVSMLIYICACTSHPGSTVFCAIPWFIVEKRRPGLAMPPGASLATIGFKQTFVALRECLRLKQTFLYLAFYFLM